jgi:hypothetical protein
MAMAKVRSETELFAVLGMGMQAVRAEKSVMKKMTVIHSRVGMSIAARFCAACFAFLSSVCPSLTLTCAVEKRPPLC